MKRYLIVVIAAAVSFGSVYAQDQGEQPSQREMMLAAGYKAMFTCSAIFNGGKTLEQVENHELDHIYTDYELAMALLPDAVIDKKTDSVSVAYGESMPPRISKWRRSVGCVSLPPGSRLDDALVAETEDYLIFGAKHRAKKYVPWPQGDRLPDQGVVDADKLASLQASVDRAFSGAYKGRTTAVVIVQDGNITHERYIDGFDMYTSQRTWSVAKSVAATVIGAAVHQDILDLKDSADLEEWSRPGDLRQKITIENLLHMASGLDSGEAGNRTDDIYFGGGLVQQHATKGALEATPGRRWKYANNDTMLVMRALRHRIGDDKEYQIFPFREVLHKIGMYKTNPETDWGGDYVMSSQVWTTARDLARLGMLYLNDGVWNGERILPEGWAEYVATPAPSQPPCRTPDTGCRGYGAQFWLSKNYPGVPNDTLAALGNRGQFLFIVPSRNVVIVRRGYDWRGNYFDGPAFVADVLEALE